MFRQVMTLAKAKARAMVGDESGVTAIEYGLIAAAIAVAIIGALIILGGDIAELFETASDAMNTAEGG